MVRRAAHRAHPVRGHRWASRFALAGLASTLALAGVSLATPSVFERSVGMKAEAAPGNPLPAVFATGGSGRFKESIQWLQWADYSQFQSTGLNAGLPLGGSPTVFKYVNVLTAGGTTTLTNYRDLGDAGGLYTECTLSNLQKSGWDRHLAKDGSLVATIPGTWAGDALDNLYNIGGEGYSTIGYAGTYHAQEQYANPNQMVIGLGNGYAKYGNTAAGHALRMNFDMSCRSYLNSDKPENAVKIAGLVFADAEASSTSQGYYSPEEWVQAKPTAGQTVTWRVLDTYKDEYFKCPTTSYGEFVEGGVRLTPRGGNGQECVYQNGGGWPYVKGSGGPDAVVMMEGATSGTFSVLGRGYSAIALGLVINVDFGDAPNSYGVAGSLYQPTWSGGEFSTTTDLFEITPQASMTAPSLRLGATIDSETAQLHSDHANGDDGAGSDDEDGLAAIPQLDPKVLNGDEKTFILGGVTCNGSTNEKVRGWIDWNGDGVFSADEGSEPASCGGTTSLTFSLPVNPRTTELVTKESTFLRLRAYDPTEAEASIGATGVTKKGEVEDYELPLPPLLKLTKTVTNDFGGLAKPEEWELKANGTAFPQGEYRYVEQGSVTLSEAGATDLAKSAGYEWDSLSCTSGSSALGEPTQAVAGTTKDAPNISLTNGTRTSCTFANSDLPGSLSWDKVAEEGSTFLAGSEWKLRRVKDAGGGSVDELIGTVKDCTSGSCAGMLESNPAVGRFEVKDLKWGTYELTETRAPNGYQLVSSPLTFSVISPLAPNSLNARLRDVDGLVTEGAVKNTRLTGSVTWSKVDAGSGAPLAGSSWTLSGPGLPADGVVIEDCVAAPCSTAAFSDADPDAGAFTVSGLRWGTAEDLYTIKEKSAPAGYTLSTEVHTFAITLDPTTGAVKSYEFTTPFTNHKSPVPTLPLTGGMSTDAFLIVGGGSALLAAIAGLLVGSRKRARA